MDKDKIIRMAIQCQLVNTSNREGIYMDSLEAFARLVLKEASEQPAKNASKQFHEWAVAEHAAQPTPVQEPVTWGVDWGKAGDIPCVSIIQRLPDGGIHVVAVEYAPYSYTTPPVPQPVPVKTYHDGKPWPVAPKPWVGLTDEEIEAIPLRQPNGFAGFARAIETKLREKNT